MVYTKLQELVQNNPDVLKRLITLEVDMSRQLTHKRDKALAALVRREAYHLGRKLRMNDEIIYRTVQAQCKERANDCSGKRYTGRMNEVCPVCGAVLSDYKRDRVYAYDCDKDRDVSYVMQTWSYGRELHARYRCCECDSIWEDVWERTTWSGNQKVETYGHHGKVLVDGRHE